MHLKSLRIRHLCCFEEILLDFDCPPEEGKVAVLLGDNGAGKTTILRAIAMGLCDETGASALLRELYGEMNRSQSPDEPASIVIELLSDDGAIGKIETTIARTASGEPEVRQKRCAPNGFPWDDVFLCGYGAVRGGFSSGQIGEYSPVDSTHSLFNYEAQLQNPELVLRRIDDPTFLKEVLAIIDRILMFPEGSTVLTRTGPANRSLWLSEIGMGGWGDGHRVALGVVADLFGWALLYDPELPKNGVSGIVLIDEIEQHLHPTWQRRILGDLLQQFPKVQFITTSHSALCVLGTTDLQDDQVDLFVFGRDGDRVQAQRFDSPPRGKRTDQILTSYLFGLSTSWDNEMKRAVEEYSRLASKDRSAGENEEFRRLRSLLDGRLGSGESELENTVMKALDQVLFQRPEELGFTREAMGYEARRQLRELLEL